MPKKQPRVPETHAIKPNREQRRHPDRAPSQDHPLVRDTDAPAPSAPDASATNSRRKVTADKWNQ